MNSDMKEEPFKDYYNKLWKVIKEYWIPEETDEYWEDLIKELNKLCVAFGNTDAVRRMSLAFAEGRESVLKLKGNKDIDRHVIVSVDALHKRETDGVNVITLNGEKYIKLTSI